MVAGVGSRTGQCRHYEVRFGYQEDRGKIMCVAVCMLGGASLCARAQATRAFSAASRSASALAAASRRACSAAASAAACGDGAEE